MSHAQRDIEVWAFMGAPAALGSWLHSISAQGARGVQLFFVVSALTLCLSQAQRQSERHSWLNFFIRRLFRIAPMFYVALAFYTMLPSLRGHIAWPSIWHLLTTVTFTNGWNPYWINAADAVVPGGWSIAVEMFFYLLFPLMFLRVNSLRRATTLSGVALLASSVLYAVILHRPLIDDASLWETFCVLWFPNQFPVFCVGFVVYFCLRDFLVHDREMTSKLWVPLLWLSVLAIVPLSILQDTLLQSHLLFSMDFALLTACLAHRPSRLLVNRLSCYLGKISFSGYLVHFAVLWQANKVMTVFGLNLRLSPNLYFFTLVLFGLTGTMAVASITYRLIEIPGQRMGRFAIAKLRAKDRPYITTQAEPL